MKTFLSAERLEVGSSRLCLNNARAKSKQNGASCTGQLLFFLFRYHKQDEKKKLFPEFLMHHDNTEKQRRG